jgi:hypothetical protein
MNRRTFITLLGGAAVMLPVAAQAQPADRRPLVGCLIETTKEAQANLEGTLSLPPTPSPYWW